MLRVMRGRGKLGVNIYYFLGALSFLIALFVISMLIGGGDVAIGQSWKFLTGQLANPDSHLRMVMLDLRLPRSTVAITTGACLGLAGCLLQSATRNPLAETGLLGVNAGAALGVVTGITYLATESATSILAFSLTGALVASAAVLLIAAGNRSNLSPLRLILAGVALSATFRGASSYILLSSSSTYDKYRFWVLGSLSGVEFSQLLVTLPFIGAGIIMALLLIRPLGALSLGDDVATALGHHPRRTRVSTTIAVTLLTGSAVALCGPIAFLGLIAPFAARAIVGARFGAQLAWSGLLGAGIMVAADITARVIIAPYESPVSVLLAAVGGPMLIVIVRSSKMMTLRSPGGAS